MTTVRKWSKKATLIITALIAIGLVTSGCGSKSNIQAKVNGQSMDLPIEGVDIVAGGLSGVVTPVNQGYPFYGNSLSIQITFVNGNNVDWLRFDILDTSALMAGQAVYVDMVNVVAGLYLGGSSQYLPIGSSFIVFQELGLAEGQSVIGDFELISPVATMVGHFDSNVRLGY